IEARQNVDLEKLAAACSVTFFRAEREDELKTTLNRFFTTNDKPVLLEIKTPFSENAEAFDKYLDLLKNLK
ncbi:MAG TPA: hypothetical protein PLK12_13905, partial [Prolixibacteraceae bacterium]|nr:hypothetical protein [Prolixibacteraceae bacterium]